MFASAIKKGQTSKNMSRWAEGVALQHAGMLQGHGDEQTCNAPRVDARRVLIGRALLLMMNTEIIRSRARPINTHLASTGGALHVYSQEQRRRGGTTQQDAPQSFCENSSASFKRSLNIKFVLIYALHNIIVCDLFHPIVACQGPLIHPVHLI